MGGRTRRFPKDGSDVGAMLDGISAVLGALVVLTPFLFLETGNSPAALNAFACGFAVMGLAFLDGPEPEPWTRWASSVLGAWVAVSPWMLQRALLPMGAVSRPPMAEPAISMAFVLGVGIAVVAALDIVRTTSKYRRSLTKGRSTAYALREIGRQVPAFLTR